MNALDLKDICLQLDIEAPMKSVNIKHVGTSIREINDYTLIFHLNRKQELNTDKFNHLRGCYIITDQPILKEMNDVDDYFIYVVDVEAAYKRFVDYYRNSLDIKTVAVTGTCGKTTTKEMIKQCLNERYNVKGTIRSKNALRFNHDYLMELDETTDYAVFETAITEPGHIVYSCNFFKPNIGVITNIGIDHLNGCKTLENYIQTKGEMLAGLEYKGILIINGDDENINQLNLNAFKGSIIRFGIIENADFYASEIVYLKDGMNFTLIHNEKEYRAYVPGIGEHNVYNALATLAVLYSLGIDLTEAITMLRSFKPVSSHLEFHEGLNDSTIIDDTWSSNPTSVKAAFEAFKTHTKKKVAVLGNIAYLGEHAKEQCKKIGKMLIDYNIDYLITKDAFSREIGKQARVNGMDPKHIFNTYNEDEMVKTLESLLDSDTMVLFKVSMFDKSMIKIMNHFIKK
ncbi:Mur ligase family protein [Haloplasma contractile]|uniref:UDP-N-acetylmuramoyl-tripeptide--D-alanyl-D-alanine ligase protein n=1 Tax=Haloplasma contractile SSD-17B TaxID=1033810 RepID=U2E7E3_9MOLU|nr:UDP-N-acetylmuramoyl-tripeptide--D-alanyl-D-alanine ligase [Haloplasma contractile]ERJ11123.1 UDP-N-acetylmuramoyl-tripeptide--D-alanyl-D-alanine ligase protein [Haloplasma contractile SSD-17B]